MLRTFVTIAAALVPSAALADEAIEVLAPVGAWEMNYDADSCRLIGNFGQGDNQVAAVFTRFEPGDAFDLKLYGSRLRRSGSVYVEVSTDFASDGTIFEGRALRGNSGEIPLLLVGKRFLVEWHGDAPPAITPEQERGVRSLTVRVERSQPFRLALGSMGAPMAAMRECTANLVRSWGFDPEEQASRSRPVVPLTNPGGWLESRDYPSGALHAGNNGVVQFRLTIEADGRIAGCAVQAATAGSEFATTTCNAISRRARLQPALNAAGQPVRSYYVNTVRWMIPER